MIYMCLSNNPSSGDINSSNLPCSNLVLLETCFFLENHEDPDKMLHNAPFNQDLHCLIRQKRYSGTKCHYEIPNLTP